MGIHYMCRFGMSILWACYEINIKNFSLKNQKYSAFGFYYVTGGHLFVISMCLCMYLLYVHFEINICLISDLLSFFNYLFFFMIRRKDGQDTQDELQKRNLRDELEERERRHFSSKDKAYGKGEVWIMSLVSLFIRSLSC